MCRAIASGVPQANSPDTGAPSAADCLRRRLPGAVVLGPPCDPGDRCAKEQQRRVRRAFTAPPVGRVGISRLSPSVDDSARVASKTPGGIHYDYVWPRERCECKEAGTALA